ncbi:4-demethylwyosine synthase TYW1 [Candidatus Pacearchaeota archaeon]|nr:4-demethylwyosine synthase TYW1 [Candidatus Pacearchaeota archaeon]
MAHLTIIENEPVQIEKQQLSNIQKAQLVKQGYRLIGAHSAVKTCEWTRKMLRGQGGCYKYLFYGIRSHQCMQMTTSMFCASRCKFCWRGEKAPVSKNWYGPIDSPEHIIKHAIDEHISLLQGFKGMGSEKANKLAIKQMENVRHVALSLTGEPITYPLINEILNEFHKRKISTFLVTNSQYPEQIKKIENVTQLYLSIDASNKELMKKIDRPLFKDFWERMLECLELLKTRKYRTCIRLTLIKNENMEDVNGYAELIKRGMPDFVELKSYVHVGESRNYYEHKDMPLLSDMEEFMNELLAVLPEYEYIRTHKPSRAILLVRKSLNKKTWINFPRFFELVNSNKDYSMEDYASENIVGNE